MWLTCSLAALPWPTTACFDLQRGVFGHRRSHDTARRSPRRGLAEEQRGLRVDVDEDDLDRHLVGLVGGDHLRTPSRIAP